MPRETLPLEVEEKIRAQKQDYVETALSKRMVKIHVDARVPGVDLPKHLMGSHHVPLNLSWKFDAPMVIDADGIKADLRFGGSWHGCRIPWDAVWAVDDGYAWPNDVPPEVKLEPRKAEEKPAAANKSPPGRKYGHLTVVK